MRNRNELHEYQKKAIDYIHQKKRCMLMLFMGAGKTVSTLTAMSDLLNANIINRVLVIAPLRVANSVWAQECAKWQHLRDLKVSVCTGSERERMAALMTTADVYTINRENVPWLVKHYGKDWPFDAVVIDESSSFKSSASQRWKALKRVLPYTDYMVLLTGTPSPNGLIDLWAQLYLIDFGQRLGRTISGYRQQYFEQDWSGYRWSIKPGSADKIHSKVSDVCLSMSASDYLELPPRIDLTEYVELPASVQKEYERFERELLATLPDGEEIEAINAAVLANKLLQWCNGATYTDNGAWSEVHQVKIDALRELIEQNDEPILVAYNYKTDVERIKKAFPYAVVLDKNSDTIARWNQGDIKLLLAHPACLHPSTEVLTENRGWVKIVDVKDSERVFDGVEFVNHKGCKYSGVKTVIDVFGIKMTPDHKMLIGNFWKKAKNVQDCKRVREKARYVYKGNDSYLSDMLPLWKGTKNFETERLACKQRKKKTLPLLFRRKFPQNDKYSFLVNMATHGKPRQQKTRQTFQKLWRYRARCDRKLDGISKFLQRYVPNIFRKFNIRANRQRKRILQRKLQMGNKYGAAIKQAKQSKNKILGRNLTSCGILQKSKCKPGRNNSKAKQWNDCRTSIRRLSKIKISQKKEISKVYDLVDCGPRSRFLIRNNSGEVFISHNSAGHGLNLQQGGSLCVWFGLNWSLELYQQFNARLHRQGQTKPVRVVHIVAKNCIDERVIRVLTEKDVTQSNLLKALKRSD